MPPAVGAVVGAGAALYGAKKQSDATKAAAQSITDASMAERTTGSGSFIDPQGRRRLVGGKPWNVTSFIDPSIRELRERALGRLPEYRSAITDAGGILTGRLSQTRDELASNENPFIQARVNPLMARAAEGRGALTRSLTRRGLGGSSLYSSGLGNYDAAVGREIGDQRALATSEALAARTGLDTQIFNSALSSLQALQSLDASEQSIAAQNLQQELSLLGMDTAEISGLLGAAGLNLQGAQLKNEAFGRAFDALGRAIPSGNKTSSSFGAGSDWAREIGL